MKKLLFPLIIGLFLSGCSLNAIKDALAILSTAGNVLSIKNQSAIVMPAEPPSPDQRLAGLESIAPVPDVLGLETLLVKLRDGSIYPVICPGDMAARCKTFSPDTQVWINKGSIVPCNIIRNNQLYGTCIDAEELRQEMR